MVNQLKDEARRYVVWHRHDQRRPFGHQTTIRRFLPGGNLQIIKAHLGQDVNSRFQLMFAGAVNRNAK
jgi:hypothetical protein